jgi:hypothetical protein
MDLASTPWDRRRIRRLDGAIGVIIDLDFADSTTAVNGQPEGCHLNSNGSSALFRFGLDCR